MRKALQNGSNYWNGGNFYGPPDASSLQLLDAYFTQYPEDADKVVLSIKGAYNSAKHAIDGSKENVTNDINDTLAKLKGKKFLDIYEAARVDPKVPIEETVEAIAAFVKAGKIGGISLSECGAETIRRASKVHKISAVEVEFSLFTTDILYNGVGTTCAELGIPIIAYSPFSRGLLTGSVKSVSDLDTMRAAYPRFQPEALAQNLKFVEEVSKLAATKGCTTGQISLAWIKWHSGRNGIATIIPIPGGSSEAQVEENTKQVTITDAEGEQLEKLRQSVEIAGHRYPDNHKALEFR